MRTFIRLLRNDGIPRTMDVNEIRRTRIQELIELEGSIAAFAEKIDSNPDYISAILSEKTKRNLGDELARRIEKRYGLSYGALDRSISDELIEALPGQQRREVLDFIRFKLEGAEEVIAGDKFARYMTMISGLITDIQRKRDESSLPKPQPYGIPASAPKKKAAGKRKSR